MTNFGAFESRANHFSIVQLLDGDDQHIYPPEWIDIWNTLVYQPRQVSPVIVKVFQGGRRSNQLEPFVDAWRHSNMAKSNIVKLIYINTDEVKSRKWRASDLVDWLLDSHLHFILSHVHQGLKTLHWHVKDLETQLQRLRGHRGFPNSDNLACPIFLQDKYKYIQTVPEHCNNTLRVNLVECCEFDSQTCEMIKQFMRDNHEENCKTGECCGWVVKAPWTTNCDFVKYPKSESQVFRWLKFCCEEFYHIMPYIMLQACMSNRKEYKVIMLNREPVYLAESIGQNIGKSFSLYPHLNLFTFAKRALDTLCERLPCVLSDGLVRVDIFRNKDGMFVVNEFESLEANYYSKNDKGMLDEVMTRTFLYKYYAVKLNRYAKELL